MKNTGNREDTALWIKFNFKAVVFGLIFIFGVLLGTTVAVCLDKSNLDGVGKILFEFVYQRTTQLAAKTFYSSLLQNALIWLVLLLCGFCAVSTPVIACMPAFKGMGYGFFATTMLSVYGKGAVGYLLVYTLPGLIISALTLIFCCKDSLDLSRYFWQCQMPQKATTEVSPGLFCGKMIIYAAFFILAATVEAYSYQLFTISL